MGWFFYNDLAEMKFKTQLVHLVVLSVVLQPGVYRYLQSYLQAVLVCWVGDQSGCKTLETVGTWHKLVGKYQIHHSGHSLSAQAKIVK